MKEEKISLNKIIKDMENIPQFKGLPEPFKEFIKKGIESATTVRFPIATFKENNEWIAKTPLIDVCAQGETKEEAIQSIIDMIDDYMTDPYTKKPKVETIMEVNIQSIPVNLPLDTIMNNPIKNDC